MISTCQVLGIPPASLARIGAGFAIDAGMVASPDNPSRALPQTHKDLPVCFVAFWVESASPLHKSPPPPALHRCLTSPNAIFVVSTQAARSALESGGEIHHMHTHGGIILTSCLFLSNCQVGFEATQGGHIVLSDSGMPVRSELGGTTEVSASAFMNHQGLRQIRSANDIYRHSDKEHSKGSASPRLDHPGRTWCRHAWCWPREAMP